MVSATELMERYKQIVAVPPEPSNFNEEGECTSSFFENKWLRMLLVRTPENPNIVSIEVEVSLSEQKTRDFVTVLREVIEHNEFLLRLSDLGFELDLIGFECMWTASKSFETMPDISVFKALVPP
ncbi:MAG: hypothetical protein RTU92_01535 [Candidatus Thorarchaeota archaeon]